MASLLNQGTTTRSAHEIADAIDSIGGALDTGAGSDVTSATVLVMKDSFDVGMNMLADVVRRPAFAPEEIERQRTQTIQNLGVSLEDPDFIARAVLNRLIYGFHPYGFPDSGMPDTIAKITREDLREFHRRYFAPNNSILAIVGDVTADEAMAAATRVFGDWQRQAVQPPPLPEPPRPTRRIVVIDKPDSVQTAVRVGQLGIPRKTPDYMSMDQAIRILGGEGSNRLFRVLRSERGLTYSASADLNPMLLAGDITAETDTRTEATGEAVRVIVDEFTRLQRERIGDGELAGAQAYMTGSFPLTIETPGAIARQVVNVVFYDLSLDELRTYRQRANAVTPDDVLRVARVVRPARSTVDRDGRRRREVQGPARQGRVRQLRADSAERARSVRGRSQEALNKIMISCGEPSGDLYAGALAVEIRRRQPDAAIFGLGGQRLMAGGGELLADYRGLSVTGLVEAIRVLPKSLSDPQPAGGGRAHGETAGARPHRLSRFQFPSRGCGQEARRAHHLLHQPPALGLAAEPHEGHEAARGSRARDFSRSRKQIYRRCRRARAVRRPPARRSRARAGAEGRFPAGDRPRTWPPDRGAVARQPSERSRATAADHPRCGRADCRANAAGAVRHRARALARRSAVFAR